MNCVILTAGKGIRLEDYTRKANKCMLEINGKPLVEYSLDRAVDIADKIFVVIGYRGEDILNYFGTKYRGANIHYIIQHEYKGIVNALQLVEPYLDSPFYLMLGDEIFIDSKHKEMVKKWKKEYWTKLMWINQPDLRYLAMCGMVKDSSIEKTYGFQFLDKFKVAYLQEKPDLSGLGTLSLTWKGTGNCIISPNYFNYINKTSMSNERKETDFVSVLNVGILDNQIVKGFPVCSKYFNINTIEDLTEVIKYFKA